MSEYFRAFHRHFEHRNRHRQWTMQSAERISIPERTSDVFELNFHHFMIGMQKFTSVEMWASAEFSSTRVT